jgi:hypothetical protein
VDWIYVAQDRDRWLDLVNRVMNRLVACIGKNFLTGWHLLDSHE